MIFVLQDGKNNLYQSIILDAINYFKENDIAWWGDNEKYPTGHMLSSQIQCLNYLFAMRKDKEAVLELAQLFDSEIDDVCHTLNDFDPGFIAFEFAYKNEELLGENDDGAKRGTKCTSIDAFIIAKKGDKKILIPVEWKYTESYLDCENKALEISSGKKRQSRYNHLILSSHQLKPFSDLPNSAYYFEPFYEFMRQTLLVEQMIKRGLADDFLHVVIISEKNEDLLGSSYKFSPDNLETIWRNCLTDQAKFKLVQNSKLLSIFEKREEYNDLFNYLNQRYF
ncbi:MAG: hypothetical protein PHC38_05205 [Weeksellaceae bacterium]|nr:hypothetical protein [Weeksellaceae bacterium]